MSVDAMIKHHQAVAEVITHAMSDYASAATGTSWNKACFAFEADAILCALSRAGYHIIGPGEQTVTTEMVEALRNIDAEAPAKEPRDDWTSTDLDEAFYEGKLRGFWEMAVYAREALTAALGAQTPPSSEVA